DPNQMQQVFLNLINNAQYFMAQAHGGGTLTIRSQSGDDKIRVEVEDTGPGIPEENLDKIFDPFFTTKEVGEGTGLGLSVSYGIVRDHGGRIWAESEGQGSTFIVELPVETACEGG
ncbi:MAG: HAMP domain-containing sensor histidine kinase, partial [Chloroflexota bacterium]|nr:HAMP domain-containing sensor histidine kinase [Chloroflexota bacterium]